jgi:hypothetical protein
MTALTVSEMVAVQRRRKSGMEAMRVLAVTT